MPTATTRERSSKGEKSDRDRDKQAAILDAAMALFGELGFHGTTMPEVAERAGVAAGTIYRYFASKEALVNAVFQREKAALGHALLDGFPFDAPVREQFHVFWRRYAKHAAEHREAFAFLELHHHQPYLDEESQAIEMRVLEPALRFVHQAQEQKAIKPVSPALVIAMFYGAFSAMVKASWSGYFALDDEVLDAAESCVWEGIRR
jgi:AcrR family transcriptional regulator